MKYLIVIIALVMQFSVNAETMTIIGRDHSKKLVPMEIEVNDMGLENDLHSFKYFNIVKGINDEAPPINEISQEDQIRVLSLGYHLTRARNYFTNVLKAEHLNNLGKITVRYDMARAFSSAKHFTSADAEYNNAVTHKEANRYALPAVKKWGNEIWFRPAKDTVTKTPKGSIPSPDISDELLNLADSAIVDVTKSEALGLGLYAFNPAHYVSQFALILIMKKIVPGILDFVVSSIPFKVALDSAMVPEIVYHEFTHVALSDKIPLTGSFAVSEGIANYFAAVISGDTTIAGKLGKYGNSISPVEVNNRLRYSTKYEMNPNLAHHAFTYTYLWTMRDRVSKEVTFPNEDSALIFDRIVFESRKYIDFSSDLTITKSLPDALMKSTITLGLDKYSAREIRLIISQTAKKIGM